jgi:cytochrome c peroxidase
MKFVFSMKKLFFLLLLSLSITLMVSFSGNGSSTSPEELCRNLVLTNIDKIIDGLEDTKEYSSTSKKNKLQNLIAQYHEIRKYYKEIEFFIEYYSVFDAKYYINGPLVPKHEIELGPTIFEPQGFQVIEECLFDTSKTDYKIIEKQAELLLNKFTSLKEYYSTITIELPNLTEALRLEEIRIMCLTLNGYDCTINKENTKEATFAFKGIIKTFGFFKTNFPDKHSQLLKTALASVNACIENLNKNPDSDTFNRLNFLIKYCNPAYKSTCDYFEALNVGSSQVNYAVNFKNHPVFDITSINKQHFSLYRDDTLHIKQQAELGRLLFFDPILSGNNKRACASCHKPELAFTDGYDKSFAYDGKTKITRNAPTLLNAAYQKLYFHDGRIFNLEEQAGEVFHNTFEMNSSAEDIVKKLKQSSEYVNLFRNSFKGSLDTSLTFYAVMKSVAEYIKTLESKNSKFDKYIKGDATQLNKNEINGFNLFTGKALCGSCHFYPLFNGLVPPMYNDNEFEVVGTPEDSTNKKLDADAGREKISHSLIHRFAFKTPGIRNIALTAPYMHNGAYTTLDQVLDFYNKGGGVGLKFKLENQTLPFDSLGLTKPELNDIKQFLLALTDTSGTNSKPKKLPSFNNEALNKRKVGGEY